MKEHSRRDVSTSMNGRDKRALPLRQIHTPKTSDEATNTDALKRPSVSALRSSDKAVRDQAWAEFYAADWDTSVKVANRFVGESNGEDLAQKAWMKVMGRFADPEAEIRDENVRGYLWTSIRRQAIDDMRAVNRQGGASLELEERDLSATQSTEATVVNALSAEQVRDELTQVLNPSFREVFQHKADGATVEEIVEDTGVKRATVNTKMYRIREKLDPETVAKIMGEEAVEYHRSHLKAAS